MVTFDTNLMPNFPNFIVGTFAYPLAKVASDLCSLPTCLKRLFACDIFLPFRSQCSHTFSHRAVKENGEGRSGLTYNVGVEMSLTSDQFFFLFFVREAAVLRFIIVRDAVLADATMTPVPARRVHTTTWYLHAVRWAPYLQGVSETHFVPVSMYSASRNKYFSPSFTNLCPKITTVWAVWNICVTTPRPKYQGILGAFENIKSE